MSDKTGGSAFPFQHVIPSGNGAPDGSKSCEGMTLRDYFAAKAMNGFCAFEGGIDPTHGKDDNWKCATARTSYEMADAMLAERNKA